MEIDKWECINRGTVNDCVTIDDPSIFDKTMCKWIKMNTKTGGIISEKTRDIRPCQAQNWSVDSNVCGKRTTVDDCVRASEIDANLGIDYLPKCKWVKLTDNDADSKSRLSHCRARNYPGLVWDRKECAGRKQDKCVKSSEKDWWFGGATKCKWVNV